MFPKKSAGAAPPAPGDFAASRPGVAPAVLKGGGKSFGKNKGGSKGGGFTKGGGVSSFGRGRR